MSGNATEVYTGMWINWTRGRIFGSTFTLTTRDGTLLVSFITFFFTIVGTQLWRAISFLIHQSRVSPAPRDGLFHQQQVVFRNSSTPAGAAWLFLQQGWYWKGRAPHHLLRSIPWLLLAIVYIAVFAFLSIYGASTILRAAGDDRLLDARACGFWYANEGMAGKIQLRSKIREKIAAADIYRSNCYEGAVDPLLCNSYARSNLTWKETDGECPFPGDDICWRDHTIRLDTGWLDSNLDLGINTAKSDGLSYRRTVSCTVVDDSYYRDAKTNFPENVTWNFGPVEKQSNSTFVLKNSSRIGTEYYTTDAVRAYAGMDNDWSPIPGLNRSDADVHLMIVYPNNLWYNSANNDPVFGANDEERRMSKGEWLPNWTAGLVACADQHQICFGSTCKEPAGAFQLLQSLSTMDSSSFHYTIALRLIYASIMSSITSAATASSQGYLRASETVFDGYQTLSLPDDQWKTEVRSWFTTGMIALQAILRDYVNPEIEKDSYISPASTAAENITCHNQKTLQRNGTVSLSCLGLAITFILGMLLISLAPILEYLAEYWHLPSYHQWLLDDKLVLQRLVFEGKGIRWQQHNKTMPVTSSRQRFSSISSGMTESESLLTYSPRPPSAASSSTVNTTNTGYTSASTTAYDPTNFVQSPSSISPPILSPFGPPSSTSPYTVSSSNENSFTSPFLPSQRSFERRPAPTPMTVSTGASVGDYRPVRPYQFHRVPSQPPPPTAQTGEWGYAEVPTQSQGHAQHHQTYPPPPTAQGQGQEQGYNQPWHRTPGPP